MQNDCQVTQVIAKKTFDVFDTEYISSSFKFRNSVFRNALKVCLSINYGFALLIDSNCTFRELPAYSGTDQLEMLGLFNHIFILTSLPPDWSMFNVIFSYDVRQNFNNISNV